MLWHLNLESQASPLRPSPRMRKNHPTIVLLPAHVATRRLNSLPILTRSGAPRTPRKCPPRIENRPAIRLWYVQRIVPRAHASQRKMSNQPNHEDSAPTSPDMLWIQKGKCVVRAHSIHNTKIASAGKSHRKFLGDVRDFRLRR